MVYLVCSVEKMSDIEKTMHKEIEGIVFEDDHGNEKIMEVKGLLPIFTSYMKKIHPDVEWDENNLHVAIVVGNEIKE